MGEIRQESNYIEIGNLSIAEYERDIKREIYIKAFSNAFRIAIKALEIYGVKAIEIKELATTLVQNYGNKVGYDSNRCMWKEYRCNPIYPITIEWLIDIAIDAKFHNIRRCIFENNECVIINTFWFQYIYYITRTEEYIIINCQTYGAGAYNTRMLKAIAIGLINLAITIPKK